MELIGVRCMRCPKCGKFSRVLKREIDGRLVHFSDCADCGEVRLPGSSHDDFVRRKNLEYSPRSPGVGKIELDFVKVLLGILVVSLIGSTSYLYLQLEARDVKVSGLSRSLLNVQTSYSTLEENYIVLLNRTASLEEYYAELQEMYSIMREEYSALERTLSNVSSERARLQQDFMEVMAEVNFLKQELIDIRNFSKVVVLDNRTIELLSETNVTFTYDIDYNGFFEISFNSSEDVVFWIGSSVSDGVFYSRYPHYPETVFNGTFVVPVSPTAYVYVGNPNDEYNATVSFSVKYIY